MKNPKALQSPRAHASARTVRRYQAAHCFGTVQTKLRIVVWKRRCLPTPATSVVSRLQTDLAMRKKFTAAAINSRSQTWQRPVFRRTLQVQHSLTRLTSQPHELRQGAQYRNRRTCTTKCSSSTGVLAVLTNQHSCLNKLFHAN